MLHATDLPYEAPGEDVSLPPPREELPTLPYDLSPYARLCMGQAPFDDSVIDENGDDELEGLEALEELEFTAGPLLDLHKEDVPRVALEHDALTCQHFDYREGFVLSLLDGASTVEQILGIAGMPEGEALGVLCDLWARGVVVFG